LKESMTLSVLHQTIAFSSCRHSPALLGKFLE
jgi:hypothetical protein